MRVRAFPDEGDGDTDLPIITSYGKPPPAKNLPLGLCKGDCDNDEMCARGMVCLHRESGNEPVRYCKGGIEDNSRTDYCTYPIVNVTIRSSQTEEVPLLGFCEGDCDDDADCAEGLRCFQRNVEKDVPFCVGGKEDESQFGYCTHIVDGLSDINSSMDKSNSTTVQLSIFLEDRKLDGNNMIEHVVNCVGQPDQWVDCYSYFRVDTTEILKNFIPTDIHIMNIVCRIGTGVSCGVDDIRYACPRRTKETFLF